MLVRNGHRPSTGRQHRGRVHQRLGAASRALMECGEAPAVTLPRSGRGLYSRSLVRMHRVPAATVFALLASGSPSRPMRVAWPADVVAES
jgi:hypothetical protein